MADTQGLYRLIEEFAFHSKPSNASGSTPCTVQDINRVIDNLKKVLIAIVDEMETSE